MVDAEHDDGSLIVIDLVDHPVGASAGRVQAREFALEAPAHAMGIVNESVQLRNLRAPARIVCSLEPTSATAPRSARPDMASERY